MAPKLPFVQARKKPGTQIVIGYRGWALDASGRRIFSETFDDPHDAYEAAMRMRGESRRPVSGETLQQACDVVLGELRVKRTEGTVRWYDDHLRAVRKLIPGETPLTSITAESIEQYIRDRLAATEGRRCKPATVNADLRALHRVFAVAIRRGVVDTNPVRQVDRPRADAPAMDWFTQAEFRDLLAKVDDPYTRDVLLLFGLTGVRRSEAARLRVENVRLRVRQLVVPGKTRKRVVPLSEDLDVPLKRILAAADGDLIPGGTRRIDELFRHAKRHVGDPRLHPHALRHTFGTALVRSGVSLDVVMRLMGHRSITTTLRYVHEVGEDAVQAVSQLRLVQPSESDLGQQG
jgi:site-specific recombinase XerD